MGKRSIQSCVNCVVCSKSSNSFTKPRYDKGKLGTN